MRRILATLITAGLAVLLLGDGLVALVVDDVSSQGNELRSGVLDVAHRLVGTSAVEAADCHDQTSETSFDEDVVPALFDTDLDAADGPDAGATAGICLRNAGTEAGALSIAFASVASFEIGECEPTESTAGDLTCGDGDDGELLEALSLSVASPTSGCDLAASAPFTELVAGETPLQDPVAAGATCYVTLTVGYTPNLSDEARAVAQTDSLTFDLRFLLTDRASTGGGPGNGGGSGGGRPGT